MGMTSYEDQLVIVHEANAHHQDVLRLYELALSRYPNDTDVHYRLWQDVKIYRNFLETELHLLQHLREEEKKKPKKATGSIRISKTSEDWNYNERE